MKKSYVKPRVVNNDGERAGFPLGVVGAIGALAGYAAARAVTNASRATPVIKIENLSEEKQ